MVELLSDPFLITQNGAYLWINGLIFYIDVARRYVIGNPASSSAHVCEDKHFTSLRGNEHKKVKKELIRKRLIKSVTLASFCLQNFNKELMKINSEQLFYEN